jgi:isocitrate dehydrogenase
MYQQITPPTVGDRITFAGGEPIVPDMPIIPFIRGDGTGVDIWPAAQKVFDAAVAAAYGDQRRIVWFKVYAGDEACEKYGQYQ